ncbi:hypothetical protein BH10BAC3_BH10BAC3_16220 [soil metagenome]
MPNPKFLQKIIVSFSGIGFKETAKNYWQDKPFVSMFTV